MQQPQLKQLGHGVTQEWLYDGAIVRYSAHSAERITVDTLVEAILTVNRAWPLDRPYLVLLDGSQMGLTPYTRQRMLETNSTTPPGVRGRYAVVLPGGILGSAVRLFMAMDYGSKDPPEITGRGFTDCDKALAWLAQMV